MLIWELPKQLRLAYCLARDPRTPAPLKATLVGALAIILNPAIDLPAWIPVVGQMDAIALTVLAVRTFNSQAPRELREELEAQIRAGESRFDLDLKMGAHGAQRLAGLVRRLPVGPQRGALPQPPGERPTGVAAWYRSPGLAGGLTDEAGGEAGPEGAAPSATEEHSI
jgi:uncharacterized membrane protein YkvA (DUF1232 family)